MPDNVSHPCESVLMDSPIQTSLNLAGSLSNFWHGFACACC